jgi:TPR repeat protein/ATP-dependent 26S proteasome regulatory subunit
MESVLQRYIKARKSIIWCNTNDEARIDELLKEAIGDLTDAQIYEYTAEGSLDFETKTPGEEERTLRELIDLTQDAGNETAVFLLIKNTKEELEKPEILAQLKRIGEKKRRDLNFNFTIIIVSDFDAVPSEIEPYTSVWDVPKLSLDEIKVFVREFAGIHHVEVEGIDEIAGLLKGLGRLEIDQVLSAVLVNCDNISIANKKVLIKEKHQILKRKSSVLEPVDFEGDISDIGGLNRFKNWLEKSAKIFKKLEQARAAGIPVPKGVLLVGMPGTGKSLAAKVTAGYFEVPLFKMDMSKILSKYQGESGKNFKKAINYAESVSPCILWIDEIEKAFSGVGEESGSGDMTRMFGDFLTWLQESASPVFLVATANDPSKFRPEFVRRFSAKFLMDFPSKTERKKIFEILLKKKGKDPTKFDLKKLAERTGGYSGAEIGKVVERALQNAFFNETTDELSTDDIFLAMKDEKPLTVTSAKKIDELRAKLEEEDYEPASGAEEDVLKELAEIGDTEAQYDLGHYYFMEKNDKNLGKKYFLLAANSGHPQAQCELGWIYERENKWKQAEELYKKTADWYWGSQKNLGDLYKKQKKYNLSEKYYLMAIKSNEPEALKKLGDFYSDRYKHDLATKYYKLAAQEYAKVADQGDAESQVELGELYYFKLNRYDLAEKYLKMAADQAYAPGQDCLGWLYDDKLNRKDLAEKYYMMAAEQGYSNAQGNLGYLYWKQGKLDLAEQYMKKAADQGNARTQYNLGRFYKKELNRHDLAEKYFKMGVEQGYLTAQWGLGDLYETQGKLDLAEQIFKKAADQGDAWCQYGLGLLYDNKLNKKDLAEKYYKMAAEQGNLDAQGNLGHLYRTQGKLDLAEQNFKKAADQGDAWSQNWLGWLYANELNNPALAKKYYELAAAQGYQNAIENLKNFQKNYRN